MSLRCILVCFVSDEKSAGWFEGLLFSIGFSNLIMLRSGEVFFMPLVLGVHSAPRTRGSTVFIRFEKISTTPSPCIFPVTSPLETPVKHI